MALRTTLTTDVAEQSTPLLTGTFLDENGAAVQPDTALLTLYDEASRQVLNSREDVDIIASVTAGALSWRLTALDTVMRQTGAHHEWHVIRIDWTWGASLANSHKIRHRIVNFALIT